MGGPMYFADWFNKEESRVYQVPVVTVDLKEGVALVLHNRGHKIIPLAELTFARWE